VVNNLVRELSFTDSRSIDLTIPGHKGNPGNEAADRAAKEASGYNPNTLPNPELPPEPEPVQILIATTKSIIRSTMKRDTRTWPQARA
jgi:hypothetical protein